MEEVDQGMRASLTSRPFLLACLVNMSMGIIYVWSLFLLPMEASLGIARSALSLVPATSLVCFTIGMLVHDRLLRRLSFRTYALICFGLAGFGHILFAFGGSFLALEIGYGLLFGFGSGLGYGLALALVTQLPDAGRSTAVGIVMAAFAISGVVLSSVLGGVIQNSDPSRSFLVIGVLLIVFGVIVASLLSPSRFNARTANASARTSFFQGMGESRFLMLGLVFFFICYTGLMVVSHATGIFSARGLPQEIVSLAPGTFTLGYIVGSFVGGKLVEALSGTTVLVVVNLVAGIGLLILLMPASPVLLAGTLAIGVVFGGAASLMPVLIGEQYGVDKIGDVYGKLMIAYGAAGLVAPWVSGQFFSATGSYTVSIVIGIAMCVGGIVLGFAMKSAVPLRGAN